MLIDYWPLKLQQEAIMQPCLIFLLLQMFIATAYIYNRE